MQKKDLYKSVDEFVKDQSELSEKINKLKNSSLSFLKHLKHIERAK